MTEEQSEEDLPAKRFKVHLFIVHANIDPTESVQCSDTRATSSTQPANKEPPLRVQYFPELIEIHVGGM